MGKLKWIVSKLFGEVPGLSHGFTLRSAGDFADPAVQEALLRGTGATCLRLLRQVHGVRIASPSEAGGMPEADAWAGRPEPGVLLGIKTADCLPVLLCHPPSGRLGLAHAGWRGATAGIAARTVLAMGAPANEILAALGPSIGPCCYEVGEEVAAAAGRAHLFPAEGGKHRFDLPGFVRSELLSVGLLDGNIDCLRLCTACRADLFFSYRKEGSTGRLCAFLGWEAKA